jgi:hypothetical protein
MAATLQRASGLLLAAALAGCFENPGVEPPPAELNFPVATVAPSTPDGGPSHLFVANANFDLRYNSGTLQSYDLEAVDRCAFEEGCSVAEGCVIVPDEQTAEPRSDQVLDVRRCEGLVDGEVLIGSFVSGLTTSPDGRRLYLSVRSDATLTYVDVVGGGGLDCGGAGVPHRCDESFRRGDEAIANDRGLQLPAEPTGLLAGELSDLALLGVPSPDTEERRFIMMSHRGGEASLFLEFEEGGSVAPQLVDVLTGLPQDLGGVELVPESGLAWMPSTTAPEVTRVGVAVNANDAGFSLLFDAGGLALSGLATGQGGDVRDVAVDPRPGVNRAYALTRSPEALLFIDLERTGPSRLAIDDVVDVCPGPSRVELLELPLESGPPEPLALVSCFNSRELYIIDLELRELVGVVGGLSGPFDLAVDLPRRRVYVPDFSTSVIHVIDLAPLVTCLSGGRTGMDECSPQTVATVGRPRPVRELL